jgi:hypothetical protein
MVAGKRNKKTHKTRLEVLKKKKKGKTKVMLGQYIRSIE